ncbi:MAG: ATP-dependent DNA ligase [Acidimicrobiales bacterium]|nr:MAG: ATP-dependent DNA ligase [Acidimicrobiales bacterium]
MELPVMPPVAPMLAKLARELPAGEGLAYEPKWDGFRTIVFRDGNEVELGSRNQRPITRYFPEILDPVRASLPPRSVVDGEIVIPSSGGLDFDALLQRIHPADSRVRLLASQTPASLVAFDLLALGDRDLRSVPFAERRALLVSALEGADTSVHLTPSTRDAVVAADWFERFEGAGLDGVVVKSLDLAYREGERAMVKVKHERTADCVVGGFRWHRKAAGQVGSLLLGLHDQARVLHHVGVTSSFTDARRRELVAELEDYRVDSLDGHPWASWAGADEAAGAGGSRLPGGTSRWTAKRDMTWMPLRPELVCEVAYDHLQANRFRHATTFRRWRPERSPESCTYAQLETAAPTDLAAVFGA